MSAMGQKADLKRLYRVPPQSAITRTLLLLGGNIRPMTDLHVEVQGGLIIRPEALPLYLRSW
jgi:hypothetical protein